MSAFAMWLDAVLEAQGRGAAQQLAADLCVSPSTVMRWRRGQMVPSPENVACIEAIFGPHRSDSALRAALETQLDGLVIEEIATAAEMREAPSAGIARHEPTGRVTVTITATKGTQP